MSKKYFIDSENVGDSWISLLNFIDDTDEVLVFYTDKSPHMSYESAIALKNSNKLITFIKCNEGNNALDFQLGTHLGFLVNSIKEDDSFIIVSNDTGFDALVKYWRPKNISISRIQGKNCNDNTMINQQFLSIPTVECTNSNDNTLNLSNESNDSPSAVINKPSKGTSSPITNQMEMIKVPKTKPSAEEAAHIILEIFGRNDLQLLFQAITLTLGTKVGKQHYKKIKANGDNYVPLSVIKPLSKEQKQLDYCHLVFNLTKPGEAMPSDLPDFTLTAWRNKKNLNSLRAAMEKHYGKNKADIYYKVIKTHVKILDQIQ